MRRYTPPPRSRVALTIDLLDTVSRTRALSDSESLELERCINLSMRRPRYDSYWLPEEDCRAAEMRAKGKKYREIGRTLGRSGNAVAARLRYRRKTADQRQGQA